VALARTMFARQLSQTGFFRVFPREGGPVVERNTAGADRSRRTQMQVEILLGPPESASGSLLGAMNRRPKP
jgi:hypothetical protein